jgi:uncharacterized membrane protein
MAHLRAPQFRYDGCMFFESLDRFLVSSHVVAGFLALVIAPLAMLTVKGGLWHRRWGKVYFYSMAWIFISTLGLSFFRFNPFLFVINILSFYQAITGYRVLYRKKPELVEQRANWIDWTTSIVATAGGAGFVLWGAFNLISAFSSGQITGFVPFFVLGIVFGASLARGGVADMRDYRAIAPKADKRWWYFSHLTRFGSAYIATVTAFLVQNVGRFSLLPGEWQWITWVLPGVIGGILISSTVKRHRARFEA